jgi:hypothetical protein
LRNRAHAREELGQLPDFDVATTRGPIEQAAQRYARLAERIKATRGHNSK